MAVNGFCRCISYGCALGSGGYTRQHRNQIRRHVAADDALAAARRRSRADSFFSQPRRAADTGAVPRASSGLARSPAADVPRSPAGLDYRLSPLSSTSDLLPLLPVESPSRVRNAACAEQLVPSPDAGILAHAGADVDDDMLDADYDMLDVEDGAPVAALLGLGLSGVNPLPDDANRVVRLGAAAVCDDLLGDGVLSDDEHDEPPGIIPPVLSPGTSSDNDAEERARAVAAALGAAIAQDRTDEQLRADLDGSRALETVAGVLAELEVAPSAVVWRARGVHTAVPPPLREGTTSAFYLLILWLMTEGLSTFAATVLLVFWRAVVRAHPALADGRVDLLRDESIAALAVPGSTLITPASLRTLLLGDTSVIQRFAVCPRCHELHPLGGVRTCRNCIGTTSLYAENGLASSLFVVSPVRQYLARLLMRPGVEEALRNEFARPRDGFRRDYRDGSAWDNWEESEMDIRMALSVDGFQPLKGVYTSSHSCGGILLMCLSLPQSMREQQEYIHLSGVTPGPRGPKHPTMWRFLQPLVGELLALGQGARFATPSVPQGRLVRVRLHVFCGDWIERTKIGGLPLHMSLQGCSWCHAETKGPGQQRFIEMPEAATPARDPARHRAASLLARRQANAAQLKRHYTATGARFSILYVLPYWSSVLHMPVDFMHGLHLGWNKHFWRRSLQSSSALSLAQLAQMQDLFPLALIPDFDGEAHIAADFGTPSGPKGRAGDLSTFCRIVLPVALLSVWSTSFTSRGAVGYVSYDVRAARAPLADDEPIDETSPIATDRPMQRRWVQQLDILRMALLLCQINDICRTRALSADDVDLLDFSLRSYVKLQISVLGVEALVPYSHALLHLPAHIRRYGPPAVMSAYTFETMWGEIGKIRTNKRRDGSMEASYVKTFAADAQTLALSAQLAKQPGIAHAAFARIQSRGKAARSLQRFLDLQTSTLGLRLCDDEPSRTVAIELSPPLASTVLDDDIFAALVVLYRTRGLDNAPPHTPANAGANGRRATSGVFNRVERHANVSTQYERYTGKRGRSNASRHHQFVIVGRLDGGARPAHVLDLFVHALGHAPPCLFAAVRFLSRTHPTSAAADLLAEYPRCGFSVHHPLAPDEINAANAPIVVVPVCDIECSAAVLPVQLDGRDVWVAKARHYSQSRGI